MLLEEGEGGTGGKSVLLQASFDFARAQKVQLGVWSTKDIS